MASIFHAGRQFPVMEAWAAANIDPWPNLATMPREDIDAERKRLLLISEDRRLTAEERSYLKALDNHFNARNALKVLGLEDPDAPAFAYVGADQIHGNRITFDCGCELNVIFDHHLAMAVSAAGEVIQQAQVMKVAEADPEVAAIVQPKVDAVTAAFEAHAELARVPSDPAQVVGIDIPAQPHTPRYVCDDHAHIEDLSELHATVVADNAKMEADETPLVQ